MDARQLTTVALAQSKSRSLRTTIPAGFARALKLSVGDQLEWELEAKQNDLVLTIRVVARSDDGELNIREPPRKGHRRKE